MAKISSLKNMVVTLLLITFIAAVALGAAYVLTEKPIAAARLAKINQAIAEVTPPFDNSPSDEAKEVSIDGRTLRLFPAKKGGALVGIAVETATTKGFGGLITLMVGFLPDGAIYNTSVIAHAETPGLGDKIDKSKSDFSVQFEGKNPDSFKLAVKKDGGDVDAITASTISSRAFCDAVERAYRAVKIMNYEL
ncbi:MAG: RnfABCDGE type electron transport complex subunit G [Prevotellaceae bacterium]|jgi:electron transport complex protein RnfG|nr:RnfABCDGE type electron transport complex subunit G [Prevotellaceae bacterium]